MLNIHTTALVPAISEDLSLTSASFAFPVRCITRPRYQTSDPVSEIRTMPCAACCNQR